MFRKEMSTAAAWRAQGRSFLRSPPLEVDIVGPAWADSNTTLVRTIANCGAGESQRERERERKNSKNRGVGRERASTLTLRTMNMAQVLIAATRK